MPDRNSPYIAGWRDSQGAGGSWYATTANEGWRRLAAEVRRNGRRWADPYFDLQGREDQLNEAIEALATALESRHERGSHTAGHLTYYVTDNDERPRTARWTSRYPQ